MPNPTMPNSLWTQVRRRRYLTRNVDEMALGPWPKGLRNRYTVDVVQPGELSAIQNLDILEDGSLFPRRGVTQQLLPGFPSSGVINMVSEVYQDTDIYAVFGASDGAGNFNILATNNNAFVTVHTWNDGRFYVDVAAYNGIYYFVPSGAGQGVSTAGLGAGAAVTSVPNMPIGNNWDKAFIFRDRMFIVNKGSSTIHYSKATDPTTWAAPDGGFFTIATVNSPSGFYGINEVIVTNTGIYIFKTDGIWLFTFTTDPAIDGMLRKISSISAYAAALYENVIYFAGATGIYALRNTTIQLISDTLKISADLNTNMGMLRELLIITTSTTTYVYNTHQNCWTTYLLPNYVTGVTFYPAARIVRSFQFANTMGSSPGATRVWYIHMNSRGFVSGCVGYFIQESQYNVTTVGALGPTTDFNTAGNPINVHYFFTTAVSFFSNKLAKFYNTVFNVYALGNALPTPTVTVNTGIATVTRQVNLAQNGHLIVKATGSSTIVRAPSVDVNVDWTVTSDKNIIRIKNITAWVSLPSKDVDVAMAVD